MTGITITIGRNVGDVPMSPTRWADFRAHVGAILDSLRADIWAEATYVGRWDGQAEEAAIWHAGVEGGLDVERLDATLGRLAHAFGQEAIGLTVGPARLAAAEVTARV